MHRTRSTFFIIATAMLLSLSLGAQDSYYVQLRDKNNNGFSPDRPEAFLSPRAIARRRAQHIAIGTDDLPLTDSYVTAIGNLAQVMYRLKWDNALLVKSTDTAFADKIWSFVFVKSVTRLKTHGASTVHKRLDANTDKSLQGSAIDTTIYGVAASQNVMIQVNALHQLGYWGDGVLISIMDAGFINVPTNTFFSKVYAEHRVLYTWDYVYDRSNVYLSDEHGAEAFSDIAAYTPQQMVGTAPNAEFLLFNTEDTRSETIVEEYNWANAAEVADSMGADVFSTSLGYTTFDADDSMDNTTYAMLDGHTTPMAKAANAAANKGILVLNSAGNEGTSAWHYLVTPADADSVVAVGAVTSSGSIASFSSRGLGTAAMIKPNLCAQGQSAAIVLTIGATGTANGTSFACPILAGAFACLREAFPQVPNMIMIDAVQRSGNYATNPNYDYGYGIPDFGVAYSYLKTLYPDSIKQGDALVYPNPFNTSLTINLTELYTSPVAIDLYDLMGKKVWEGSFAVDFTSKTLALSLPALATGSYILRINNTHTVRLVKLP